MLQPAVAHSWLKRFADIVVSAILLIILFPLMLVVGIVIRMSLGSPVLFRQVRPGLGGKEFEMVKFRTMASGKDAAGKCLPDEQRLTRLGTVLRALSIDELPELWNVLKGEMSLIGPRPLLPQYLDRYTEEQARRHEARPGVTGWAQVNGRNTVEWESRFEMDVWYIDNWSLALDLKILFMTIGKVFRRDGVSQDGHVTMPEFMGISSGDGEAATK